MKKGQQAPVDGVLLTAPLAAEFASKLDQCVSQLDLEKQHSDKKADIERTSCSQKLMIVMDMAGQKEALLKQAIAKEQERNQEAAASLTKSEMMHWVWGAVGVGVGLLLGVAVAGGTVVYFTAVAPAN